MANLKFDGLEAAVEIALSGYHDIFHRLVEPEAPAWNISMQSFCTEAAKNPPSGWLDNVTNNKEIARDIEIHRRRNIPYNGPPIGSLKPHAGDSISQPKAVNRHLDLYINKLGNEGRKSKRKAEAVMEQEGGGKAAEENDAQEDDPGEEDNPIPRAPRALRPVDGPSVERLRKLLLGIKPMVEQGIANAFAKDRSSHHGFGPGIITPNYEYDGFRFSAHQKEGIYRWEQLMRAARGVLLCDEVGLGKTTIAVGVIQRLLDAATAVGESILVSIVVPSGLVHVWRDALARSKTIRTGLYSSARVRRMTPKELKKTYDVLIITHGPYASAVRALLLRYNHRQAIKEGLGHVVSGLLKTGLTPDLAFDEDIQSLDLDLLVIDEAHWIKDNRQKASTREKNNLNNTILACIRSYICIRRLNGQEFDGVKIGDGLGGYDTWHIENGVSHESRIFQLQTRDIWDAKWKRSQAQKDLADRLGEENDLAAENNDDTKERRGMVDTLVAISEAKMHIIHPDLLHAKYGNKNVDAEDLTLALGERAIDPNDVKHAERILGPQKKKTKQMLREELEGLSLRRKAFRMAFEGPDATNSWEYDRIRAVVKRVETRLGIHATNAMDFSAGSQRNEYISRHKILVFCEYLSALDLVEIGLATRGIQVLRFDGSMNTTERNAARAKFEEEGKDFSHDATLPDEHLVMLITTKASNEGISLIHATDSMLMSPNWNPAVEDQACSLSYREGQTNRVTIFKFSSENSIEVRIQSVQISKRAAVRSVLSDKMIMKTAGIIRTMDDQEFLDTLGYDRCIKVLASGKLVV